MIKTLFFDFGNVIAKFDHFKAVRRFSRYCDLPEQTIYDRLYDNTLEDSFERGLLTAPEYAAEAIRVAGMSCTPEQFIDDFIDIFTPNTEVIDAIPILARSYRIVLASNTNDAHFIHYCIQFHDTLKHFAATPTSHQCGHRKPEPGYYDYCQRFAEAEPEACLFIDDVQKNIDGGMRHGWQALHYVPGTSFREQVKPFGLVL